MGCVQWTCGVLVVARELCYLALIVLGMFVAPQYLLFQPFTETDSFLRIWYFTSPQSVIGNCIFTDAKSIFLVALPCTIRDAAAGIALLTGVIRWSVVWPALIISYLTCSLSFT